MDWETAYFQTFFLCHLDHLRLSKGQASSKTSGTSDLLSLIMSPTQPQISQEKTTTHDDSFRLEGDFFSSQLFGQPNPRTSRYPLSIQLVPVFRLNRRRESPAKRPRECTGSAAESHSWSRPSSSEWKHGGMWNVFLELDHYCALYVHAIEYIWILWIIIPVQ